MAQRQRARRTSVDPDTADTVIAYGPWHLTVWLWPWGVALTLPALGGVTNLLWGQSQSTPSEPWPVAALALAAAGLVVLTYRVGRARGTAVRWHAAGSVAAAGAWLAVATVTGPAVRPTLDGWVLLALALPISWNVRRGLRGNGRDGQDGWGELAEAVRLPGSRVLSPVVRDGHQVTATIEVAKGEQTSADVAAARLRIASGLGAPPGGVRVQPDPDNAARARLVVVTRDLLRRPTPWPGPSAPGGSIAEPLVIGVRESGSPLQLHLPGEHQRGRSATHVLVTGMTGAGKSAAGRLLLAEVLTRRDAQVYLVDAVKGAQFTGPFADRVARLATTVEQARALVAELPSLIASRADDLGRRGYDQWAPGCGLPYLVVHVEEAASVVASSRPFVLASQTGRSAGLSLVVSLQRATHQNLPVDVRSQMAAALAFGCRNGDERFSGLSESTLDGGAAPQSWGASRPGYVYAETPGSDPESWATPARTYTSTAAAVDAALGAFHHTDPDEIGPQHGLQRASSAAPTDARVQLRARLDELAAAGVASFRPADLADVRRTAGRSPAWLTAELARLVEAGELAPRGRGVYAHVHAEAPVSLQASARPPTRGHARGVGAEVKTLKT